MLSFLLHAQQVTLSAHAIDSLLTLVKTDKQDTAQVSHFVELSKQYRISGDIDNSRSEANKAIDLAEKTGNKKYIAKANVNNAYLYKEMGVYPDALSYFLTALKTYENLKDEKGMANTYNGIGLIYKEEKNYPEALKNYYSSLQHYTTANDKHGMSICYNNIGVIFRFSSDFKEALSYYQKALSIDRELNDKAGIAADMANVGNVNAGQGDTAKAMGNFKKSLDIFASIGDKANIAILTDDIGEIYLAQKNIKEAEKYLNASLTIAKNIGDLRVQTYNDRLLSEIYAYTKDFQKAYEYHVDYTSAADSLAKLDDTKKLVSEALNFQFQQQEAAQKAEQEKKDLIHAANNSRQRLLILLFAATAILVAFIALFILRALKAAQREKVIAEQQKSLMELKALRAQMNPHFIFNAINSIQHFILKNDPDEAQKHLNKFAKLIRKVLENSRKETITLSEEIAMLQLYTELESVRFSSKFQYSFVVGDHLNPDQIMVPPLLIQPFVENAIWHGLMHLKGRPGKLLINFEQQDGTLKCVIDDNGIGRNASQEMRPEAKHEPMGLSITHERVNLLNEAYHTHINVMITDKTNEDGSAAGTKVEVNIPVN
jgi:tetratricopeptide (TPR) repeat protein